MQCVVVWPLLLLYALQNSHFVIFAIGQDTTFYQPPTVLMASGHITKFADLENAPKRQAASRKTTEVHRPITPWTHPIATGYQVLVDVCKPICTHQHMGRHIKSSIVLAKLLELPA